MKSFMLIAALVTIVIGSFIVAFRQELKLQILDYFIKTTATNSIVPATEPSPLANPGNNASGNQTQKFVPPGFRGPTGEPHIIGPSGNPPNY